MHGLRSLKIRNQYCSPLLQYFPPDVHGINTTLIDCFIYLFNSKTLQNKNNHFECLGVRIECRVRLNKSATASLLFASSRACLGTPGAQRGRRRVFRRVACPAPPADSRPRPSPRPLGRVVPLAPGGSGSVGAAPGEAICTPPTRGERGGIRVVPAGATR